MARTRSLGSVKPRKGGGWRARYYDSQGVQREGYAPTEAAARRIILERSGRPAPPATARVTFGVMAQEAVDTLPTSAPGRKGGVSDSTRYGYRAALRTYAERSRVWRMPAHKVTAEHLQALVDEVQGRGHSARTARTFGQVLRTVYRQGVKNGRVATSPMDQVDLPPIGHHAIRPMTAPETQALLGYLDEDEDRLAALYVFLTGTGVRINEALALRWADLDLDGARATANIHATLTRRPTVSGPAYQDHTKTPHGRRTLPILPNVREALVRHRREVWGPERIAAGAAWARGAEFADFVFTRPNGHPMWASSVNKHLERVLEDSGVGARRLARLEGLGVTDAEPLRLHDLRHGFATQALEAGVPMVEVSRWLGHSSERITSDVYYQWTAVAADRMVATMAAIGY